MIDIGLRNANKAYTEKTTITGEARDHLAYYSCKDTRISYSSSPFLLSPRTRITKSMLTTSRTEDLANEGAVELIGVIATIAATYD